MNGVEVFRTAFGGAHNWFNGTVADVSDAQANSVPPGIVHPIGELAAHILHSEDGLLSVIRGTRPIWETDGYGDKLGLAMMMGQDNEVARAYRVSPAQLTEYASKVFAQTDAYLASLTDADLDREVDLTPAGMGKMPLAAFLATALLGNTYAHTGEISALKGLHGEKGYPF